MGFFVWPFAPNIVEVWKPYKKTCIFSWRVTIQSKLIKALYMGTHLINIVNEYLKTIEEREVITYHIEEK